MILFHYNNLDLSKCKMLKCIEDVDFSIIAVEKYMYETSKYLNQVNTLNFFHGVSECVHDRYVCYTHDPQPCQILL